MIEVQGLTRYYADRPAIQELTFSVPRGQVLGFLGPNGAGKSTTMRILTGYLGPSSGTASVAGFDLVDHSLEARRRWYFRTRISFNANKSSNDGRS